MISNSLIGRMNTIVWSLKDEIQGKYKHFTFIVRKSQIVCFSFNKCRKTHPLGKRYGFRYANIHSELGAILNFPYKIRDLRYYDFINVRIMANGSFGMSCPCSHCQKMLISFGINEIIYTNQQGKFTEFKINGVE